MLKKLLKVFGTITNVTPMVETFAKAGFVRVAASVVGQLGILIYGVYLFYRWCVGWEGIADGNFWRGVGFFIMWVPLLLAGFVFLRALFARVGAIRELPEGDYAVAPMLSLVIRAIGEAGFCFYIFMSVPFMVSVWFGCRIPFTYLPPSYIVPMDLWVFSWAGDLLARPGNWLFWPGVRVFLSAWALGFVGVLSTRLIGEFIQVLMDLAQDLRIVRRKAQECEYKTPLPAE